MYGRELDAVNDDETDVSNYCDWTNITRELRARRPDWPIGPVAMVEQSVANFDEIATGAGRRTVPGTVADVRLTESMAFDATSSLLDAAASVRTT